MALLYPANPAAIPNQGGVLVMASGTANAPLPMLIADAHSLNAAVHERRLEAARRGVDLIFVWPQPKAEERAAAVADLRAAYGHPDQEKTGQISD